MSSEKRKIKNFSVYTATSYTVTSGGETSQVYSTSQMYTSTAVEGSYKQLDGNGGQMWHLELDSDSIDEILAKVRSLMDAGHALPKIRVDRNVEISKEFKLLA